MNALHRALAEVRLVSKGQLALAIKMRMLVAEVREARIGVDSEDAVGAGACLLGRRAEHVRA